MKRSQNKFYRLGKMVCDHLVYGHEMVQHVGSGQ